MRLGTAAISSRKAIIESCFFGIALVSVCYAVLTAPKVGLDLGAFQQGGREWLDGTYRIGFGPIGEYPPFALPLFSPLALVSFDKLMLIWLALKIVATLLSLVMVIKLWGAEWPVRIRLYLSAFLLTWAPFRVTLRMGQISLFILALLLGSLLARRKGKSLLAGVLLGLSLCKYSLTFPFILYFAYRKEWKLVSSALLVMLILTEVFALRLGLSLLETVRQYVVFASHVYLAPVSADMGTSEIKLLLLDLSGGNGPLAAYITLSLSVAALIGMTIAFSKRPRWELSHFAALALFALWSVYHRAYDSVFCLLPAALLTDLVMRKRFVVFSRICLGGLALLIISFPGLLVERLKMDPANPTDNPFFFLGLHAERLLVFGMFWAILILIWKAGDVDEPPAREVSASVEERVVLSHSG